MALGFFFLFFFYSIYKSQAAFKYAAQKSQVAATDIVLSTRHNNRADKKKCSLSGLSWHCGRYNRGYRTVRVQENVGRCVFTARDKGVFQP